MLGLGVQLNINSNGGSFYRGGAAQLVADYQARVLAAGGVVENTTCLTKDLFYLGVRNSYDYIKTITDRWILAGATVEGIPCLRNSFINLNSQ
jgi:hypothetical protein